MNAKLIVLSLTRALTNLAAAELANDEPARLKAGQDITELREEIYQNSSKIWVARHRGDATQLHMNAPSRIYREMLIPYQAVCVGLRNAGLDPLAAGLTDTFLFDPVLTNKIAALQAAFAGRNDTYSFSSEKIRVCALIQTLREIGFDTDSPSVKALETLLADITAAEMKPVYEYVKLVDESLLLRAQIEVGQMTRKMEERLVAISSYIYRSENEMMTFIHRLPSEVRAKLIGGNSMSEFAQRVKKARQRYETTAKREQREKAEAEQKRLAAEQAERERLEKEELELWRKVAKVECRHRYGHDNAVLSNDYNPDGHFYAGQEETEWLVYPDGQDPGVSAVKLGSHCLCHFHKLEEGRFIPRNYTQQTKAA